MTFLELRAGRLAVELAPHAGGSITRLTVDGSVDVLRRTAPETVASGRGNDASCYPLVPFSNRIANGRFAFDGKEISLEPNWPGVRHPMHGDGWARPWEVARRDDRSAELVYEHDGRKGWPFRYRARQGFRLDDAGLALVMSVENLERHDVPAGLGLHPFFVRQPDTELACRLRGVWRTDREVLPTERVPVPPEWDFAKSRRVDDVILDNCFDGWDGQATITWPQRGMCLVLSATEAFRHLVIYVPQGSPFFCVEPVSHANGAIGQTRLVAGATLAGEISFRLSTP